TELAVVLVGEPGAGQYHPLSTERLAQCLEDLRVLARGGVGKDRMRDDVIEGPARSRGVEIGVVEEERSLLGEQARRPRQPFPGGVDEPAIGLDSDVSVGLEVSQDR